MRPLRLEMNAFGPYSGKQVVDFTELKERLFFLITGPTGAGKTSILDGICFALYGESSGGERDANQLRSDHCGPETRTVVRLEFRLGDEEYRVEREPRQELAKQRGGGTKSSPASANLWQMKGRETIHLAGGVREVGEKIEALLGFNQSQFRQVVLLPQGRFREVLSASSKEREEILEALFGVVLYDRIEGALREMSKALKKQIVEKEQARGTLLSQFDATTESELEEKRKVLEKDIDQLGTELQRLGSEEKLAVEALDHGREVQRRLIEMREAERLLVALKHQETEIKTIEDRLAAARKAEKLKPLEEQARQRGVEAEMADTAMAKATTARTTAKSRVDETSALLVKEEQREPERKALEARLHELEQYRGAVEQLQQARDGFQAAKINEVGARKLKEAAELGIEQVERSLLDTERRWHEGEKLAATLDGKEALAARLQDLVATRRRLQKAEEDLAKLQPELVRKRAAARNEEDELEATRALLKRMQAAREQQQAAILALGLAEGDPCPVCGARHHPNPARATEAPPSEDAILQADEAISQRAQTLKALSASVSRLEAESAEKGAVVASLRAGLKDAADRPLPQLEKEGTEAEEALAEARTRSAELAGLRDQVEALREALARKKSDLAMTTEGFQNASKALESARGIVTERERRIPEELRNAEALERDIAAAGKALGLLGEALEAARRNAGTAREHHAAAQSTMQEAQKAATDARRIAESRRASFEDARALAGLDSETYARAGADVARIREFEAQIAAHREKIAAARARAETARAEAEGLEDPDMETLTKAASALRASIDATHQKRGTESGRLAALSDCLARLSELGKRTADQREELETVLGPLAAAVSGDPPNQKGVSLKRFVLQSLLDDVLIAANLRLGKMTRHRYQLAIVEERTDRRRAGGLDLEVFDEFTGQARPVSTLSGGEGFQASLALALGLSDVVTGHSGGVRLDTIFIDEGFGSLDPESLDHAVRALMDLQVGGRLVAAISHVEDMKLQIPTRLEVTKAREGSRARFVIS